MRSPKMLWALLALQAICTAFFVFDSLSDAFGFASSLAREAQLFEYAMTVALVGGVVLTALSLRDVMARQARLEHQIDVASGAFEEVLQTHFEDWNLTPAERDVARLLIKGVSVAELAALRGSAEGTIKAHSAAVYRKARVSGRLQLLSLFVEELMSDPVISAAE